MFNEDDSYNLYVHKNQKETPFWQIIIDWVFMLIMLGTMFYTLSQGKSI